MLVVFSNINISSTLSNYMVWQTVKNFAAYLSKAFRDAYKGLRIALMGSEEGEEPQWKYCIQDTNTVLGMLLQYFVYIYYFVYLACDSIKHISVF